MSLMQNQDPSRDFISRFGLSGFPTQIDESLKPTWDAYDSQVGAQQDTSPRNRIARVLGFLHLLNQANYTTSINPYTFYKAWVGSDFSKCSSILANELRKCRVFDLFKVQKVLFNVDRGLRDNCDATLSISVTPRKSESLDAVLAKADGFLYRGDVPVFLREKWRKIPVTSRAKPRSMLPKCAFLMKDPSVVGRMPLLIKEGCALYVSRASDDALVFHFRVVQPLNAISWLSRHAHYKLLHQLWTNSFKMLKG